LPKNGGELNYLQHAYRRPKHLVLALYASQALLLGQAAGNAGVAGRYFWRAGGNAPSQWSSRGESESKRAARHDERRGWWSRGAAAGRGRKSTHGQRGPCAAPGDALASSLFGG
jgi:hypothetical protein